MSETLHIEHPAVQSGDFGAYYPTGSVVVAFPDPEAAVAARTALQSGGYDGDELRYIDAGSMKQAMAHRLEHIGFLASLGRSEDMMARCRDLAAEACHFLVVHAPSLAESDRVMRVIRRGPIKLAQKYHTLAIEELS